MKIYNKCRMGSKKEAASLMMEIELLTQSLKVAQESANDSTMSDICSGLSEVPKLRLQTKRLLKGHINKVNSIHFSGDSRFALKFLDFR